MEKPKSKQEKKAMTIQINAGAGGGGIGRIVFLGGALIAATLVSAFAFKRGRTRRQQGKSSSDNDINHQSEAITDQPNNLELMMKNSKDHHLQVTKGLSFLLPTDSSLPHVHKNPSGDATAEMDATGIEPTQVLIMDDEKAKLEIIDKKVDPTNGVDNQGSVREEHAESTPLFDDSDKTITKEECSFPVLEASGWEFDLKELENSMDSNQKTIGFDSSVPESSVFQSYGVKLENSSVLDSFLLSNAERMNQDKFSMETPLISVEAVNLLEVVSEAYNTGPCYGDQIEVGEKQEVYDAMVQEMIVEDSVQVAEDEDQQIKFSDDQLTFKNHDEENFGSQLLAEAIEVKKEGEATDVACDHIEVGEDKPEIQLIGEELEEVKAIKETEEENGVEIICVDQVIVEDTEEVKLIRKELENEDDHAESFVEKCEGSSTETHPDQVAEEDKELVQMTEDQEILTICDEEELRSDNLIIPPMSTEAIEFMKDQIKVEDEAEVKLIEGDEDKCDEVHGDYIAKKCEDESTNIAHADEVLESLENGENNDCSVSLITEQMSSEPMVEGSSLLDSEKTPPSIEADIVDEVNEVASVIEDILPVQLTEETTKLEEVVEKIEVEKPPQMELSDEEDDDGEDNVEDENNEEKGEESSEGTGDSSMESNSDAVWPAELIQEVSPEFNEMKTNNQTKEGGKPDLFSSKENDDDVNGSDHNIDEDDENEETSQRSVREPINQSKQRSIEPWKVKAWTCSVLATLWILHWHLGLPFVKVSLITVVISIALFFGFPSHVPAKHK